MSSYCLKYRKKTEIKILGVKTKNKGPVSRCKMSRFIKKQKVRGLLLGDNSPFK